jgi:hypothetical protein
MHPIKLYLTPFVILKDIFIPFLGRAYESEKGEEGVEGIKEKRVQKREIETLILFNLYPSRIQGYCQKIQ